MYELSINAPPSRVTVFTVCVLCVELCTGDINSLYQFPLIQNPVVESSRRSTGLVLILIGLDDIILYYITVLLLLLLLIYT